MKKLINSKIIKLEICEGEFGLKFTNSDSDEFYYYAEAICCSETWFSEIINLDFLINHTVSEVKILELPNDFIFEDDHKRQDVDSFYGYSINTEAGTITIVFRCSSNGYYGGSCKYVRLSEVDHYFSYFYKNGQKNDVKWNDISNLADWTAYEPNTKSFSKFLKLKAF